MLTDGRILIVGGNAWGTPVAKADIYDPSTGTVSSTGDLLRAKK